MDLEALDIGTGVVSAPTNLNLTSPLRLTTRPILKVHKRDLYCGL